jgi:GUN4-like
MFMKVQSKSNQLIELPDLIICDRQLKIFKYNTYKNYYELANSQILDLPANTLKLIVITKNFIFVTNVNHSKKLSSIVKFNQKLEKLAVVKFKELTAFATNGETLFISSEGDLVSLDQNLKILNRIGLEIHYYKKNADQILIYQDTAYLLDNIVLPIFVLKADVSDPTNMRISAKIEIQDIYPHLSDQWLNPSLNQWCIIQSYHHRGGGGKNILIYPIDGKDEIIASQSILNYSYIYGAGQEYRGIDILAITQIPPIWAIIIAENRKIFLSKINSEGNKINFDKILEIDNLLTASIDLDNWVATGNPRDLNLVIKQLESYLFIFVNLCDRPQSKLIILEIQKEEPSLILTQEILTQGIANFELLSHIKLLQIKQPRPDDAVLGGKTPGINAAVLGGIEGVKRNLTSSDRTLKLQALSDATKYGASGIKLIEQVLKTSSGIVQWTAYNLLWSTGNARTRKELLQYFPLDSVLEIDYTKLRDLLATEAWAEANKETCKILRQLAGEKGWYLNYIPCEDLRTIDQLWVKSSNGKFGFSVQKQIYQSLGGNCFKQQKNDKKIWEKFCDRIAWRYHQHWLPQQGINFSINATAGHLPIWWLQFGTPDRDYFHNLAAKIDTCRIS